MAGVGGINAYEAIQARLALENELANEYVPSPALAADSTRSFGGRPRGIPNPYTPPDKDQKKTPGSPTFSFQDYLASLGLGGGDFGLNLPEAPDLTAGVQSQYSPVIDFLKRSVGRTKREGEQSDKNLKNIYGAMSNMSRQSGKTIAKQGRKSTKQIKKAFDLAERQRNENIERSAGDIVNMAEDLGIEQAVPSSTARLNKESAQRHRLFARQEGRAVSSSRQQTQNWANFAKTGAQTARLEGGEQRAELSQAISDAIFGLRGQIAQSKAERAAAMLQAQQAEYGMAMDAAQAQNSAAMQKAGFAQDYQSMMMQQAAAAQEAGGTPKDLEGFDLVSSILKNEAKAEPGIGRQDAASALEAIQGIIPSITGSTNSYGDLQDINQQNFYSQLAQQAEAQGIPPELYRALMSQQVYNQFYG